MSHAAVSPLRLIDPRGPELAFGPRLFTGGETAYQPTKVRTKDLLITQYGLALVFANVLIQQIGPPIPAVPTLIVAGVVNDHLPSRCGRRSMQR